MKAILAVLLFVSPLQAQDQSAAARAGAGCGPAEVQFDVKTDKKQHVIAQPEAGKALVYVFENERNPNTFNIGAATTRAGIDGAWVGANHGNSYFFLPVDPGEHRLCADWQSSLKRFSKLGSAASFTAEAGKIYFFRVEVGVKEGQAPYLALEQVDNADGQLQISSRSLSTSRPKAVASE